MLSVAAKVYCVLVGSIYHQDDVWQPKTLQLPPSKQKNLSVELIMYSLEYVSDHTTTITLHNLLPYMIPSKDEGASENVFVMAWDLWEFIHLQTVIQIVSIDDVLVKDREHSDIVKMFQSRDKVTLVILPAKFNSVSWLMCWSCVRYAYTQCCTGFFQPKNSLLNRQILLKGRKFEQSCIISDWLLGISRYLFIHYQLSEHLLNSISVHQYIYPSLHVSWPNSCP